MTVKPTPDQRAEMAAYIDAREPGLLDDLGIPRIEDTCCGKCPTGATCYVDQVTGA